jgi:hypothetical protein
MASKTIQWKKARRKKKKRATSVRTKRRVSSPCKDRHIKRRTNKGGRKGSVLVSHSSSAGMGLVMALCLTSDMVGDVLLGVVKGKERGVVR